MAKPRLKTLQSRLSPVAPRVLSTNELPRRRIRGRKLQEIRRRIFWKSPLCVECKRAGRVTLATEVDHIVPLFMGGEDSDANRSALCAACHKLKTIEDMAVRNPDGK